MQKNKKEVQLDVLMPIIREKLELGAEVSINASGNSMYPLFRHRRDRVVLKKTEGESLKKYDMILYQRDDASYVLHRVVGKGADGYILRGDHQYRNEYPVRADQVIAVVCRFFRDEKETDCSMTGYRLYAVLWVNTVFVRRVAVFTKNYMYRVLRRIHRMLHER